MTMWTKQAPKRISLFQKLWELLFLGALNDLNDPFLRFQVPLLPSAQDGCGGRAAALQLRAGHRSRQLLTTGLPEL